MSNTRRLCVPAALSFLFTFSTVLVICCQPAAASEPPDYTLYTTYSFDTGYQNVSWVVCGSTAETEGCYDAGSMGPFGRAGGLIEGIQSVNLTTSTVTRYIYVVDVAAGSGTGVTLYVYKKTDVVSSSFDTTTVTLEKTVSLPLTGGADAICSIAANTGYLFIGTNQSPFGVQVDKNNLSYVQIGGFSPPMNVTSITADRYGYVTVTFGGSIGGGFYAYGPNGDEVEDGGGSDFMLSTDIGLSTAELPTSDGIPADRLVVRPKQRQ